MKIVPAVKTIAIGLALSLVVSAKEAGKDTQSIASERLSDTSVRFSSKILMNNATLSIVGPGNFQASRFLKVGTPSVELLDFGEPTDGLYHYELTAASGEAITIKDKMNNGRGENNSHTARRGITQSGYFRVIDGKIKHFNDQPESFKKPKAQQALGDGGRGK